jgi:hypothetical protein
VENCVAGSQGDGCRGGWRRCSVALVELTSARRPVGVFTIISNWRSSSFAGAPSQINTAANMRRKGENVLAVKRGFFCVGSCPCFCTRIKKGRFLRRLLSLASTYKSIRVTASSVRERYPCSVKAANLRAAPSRQQRLPGPGQLHGSSLPKQQQFVSHSAVTYQHELLRTTPHVSGTRRGAEPKCTCWLYL